MRLTRVRGVPGGAICGPLTEAHPLLDLIRRHFLLKGYEHGVGGLMRSSCSSVTQPNGSGVKCTC